VQRELAAYFSSRRDAILAAWRAAADADPELTTASALTRTQFHDHIPGVLDGFERRLLARRPGEAIEAEEEQREGAAGHGLHRWQQGYQQREVMLEWRHLHLILVDELERFEAEQAVRPAGSLAFARRALAELCSEGVCESASEYARLQQAEAASRLRDLEQALEAVRALERQRAEAWREAAHDLRGNLGVVSSATEVLSIEPTDERVRARLLPMLRQGVASLQELLGDLTSLARLEAGHEQREIAPFDAAAVVRKLCEGMRTLAAERGLALHAHGPDALPVEGDAVKVHRIAQNLLANAIKYTESGGVQVSWSPLDAGGLERWQLVVRDTGPGVPKGPIEPLALALEEATQEAQSAERGAAAAATPDPREAREPPVRARRREPGEGIGLSIVKRLCELLDATIELETEPGAGATFRVTFPRSYPRPPA
jgi:signal transduction histidine kinase